MRARRDRAKEADVNINLPTMHDKPSCLGRIRSCLSGRRLPAPIILICARRQLSHHPPVGAHSGGNARVMDVEAGSLIVIAAQVGTAQDRRLGAAGSRIGSAGGGTQLIRFCCHTRAACPDRDV
jgi:hypothetical protein